MNDSNQLGARMVALQRLAMIWSAANFKQDSYKRQLVSRQNQARLLQRQETETSCRQCCLKNIRPSKEGHTKCLAKIDLPEGGMTSPWRKVDLVKFHMISRFSSSRSRQFPCRGCSSTFMPKQRTGNSDSASMVGSISLCLTRFHF